MENKSRVRNNYLDWLRVLGILFVFIYHSTRLYNVEEWIVKNETWYPGVEAWNGFASSFMMPLMFVISGASLFYATGRGGFARFLKDKVLRLLVPLVVCIVTHAALQSYLEAIWHGGFAGNFFQYLPQYYQSNLAWEGMHLWYLLYLFLFSLTLYPLIRWLKGSGSAFLARLDGVLARPVVLYLVSFPLIFLYIIFDPDGWLLRENGGFPYLFYLWFLLLGFLVISGQRVLQQVQRLRWVSLGLGLALVIVFVAIWNLTADKDTITLALFVAATARLVGGWVCVLAILGLGMQYLNRRSARLEYASEAVLPFYILHQTLLLVVAYFVLRWGLPDLLEWVVVVVISFPLILLFYEFLVRRWNVMRFLFGMKRLPAKAALGVAKPQPVS